jgi:hypothetical protein
VANRRTGGDQRWRTGGGITEAANLLELTGFVQCFPSAGAYQVTLRSQENQFIACEFSLALARIVDSLTE